MAGRKGTIPKENLKTVICKYKDIFQEVIPNANDNVYVRLQHELREKFNCNMTSKALQIDTLQPCHEENETDPYIVTFQMFLSEYLNIVRQKSIYRLLQRKWTNELQDQIFFKSDVECTFAFNNSYVPADLNSNGIKCTGKCTQCQAILSLNISPPS